MSIEIFSTYWILLIKNTNFLSTFEYDNAISFTKITQSMRNAYFTILHCNFQINFLQVRKCPFVWKYCQRTLRVLVKVVHLTFFLMILLNGAKVIKLLFSVFIKLVYFSVSSLKLVVQTLDDSQIFYRKIFDN